MRFFYICLIILMPLCPLTAQEAGSPELLGAQALAFAENSVAGMPGEYSFQILHPPKLPPLRPGRVTFEAVHLSKQEPVGRFFASLRVQVDGRPTALARVEMEGTWSGLLYQAKTALKIKTALTEGEVEEILFEGVPPAGALKSLPDNIRLRQPMTVGKIVTQADIEAIPLINAADRVRVTLNSGSLQIVSEATARSSGAMGDRVRVEMDGSKKILQALVTGPGEAVLDKRRRG